MSERYNLVDPMERGAIIFLKLILRKIVEDSKATSLSICTLIFFRKMIFLTISKTT
jgi:hypothetical protein